MSFDVVRSFETLLDERLGAWEEQLPDVDRSPGSMVYIQSAISSSCEYGVRKAIDWVARQMFPDTADTSYLRKHASKRGLPVGVGDTDSEVVTTVLSYMREPPAGGNQYDWPRWANDVVYTHDVGLSTEWSEKSVGSKALEHIRGMGAIDVVVGSDRTETIDGVSAWAPATAYTAGDLVKDDAYDSGTYRVYQAVTSGTSSGTGVKDDTGVEWEDAEGYATSALVAAVTAEVEKERPLGTTADFLVFAARKRMVDVTMTIVGDDITTDVVKAALQNYMMGFEIGERLYYTQLVGVALDVGAVSAVPSTPVADIVPTVGPSTYEVIWPGTISVSK